MTHHATQFDLPPQLFTWLKEACKEAKEKSEKANSDLVGHIKEEYYITSFPKNFVNFLSQCAFSESLNKYLAKVSCLSEDRPLYLYNLWVNYMKKHEFNPPHNHSGVMSFIVFIKIPYDLKEEEKQFPMDNKKKQIVHTSKVAFLNTLSDGSIGMEIINVDKSFEGKILMFPSAQIHQVFPFYTSDDYRITVSGNLRFKVGTIPIRRKKNNWGGPRKRSKTIKKIQDTWCRDNGYPIIERRRYPHYRQNEN